MGVRGEVFSARVSSTGRTYFLNVKENRAGDLFLNIVESKKHGETGFDRHQIVVFEEDLLGFLTEFQKAADFMKNNMRNKGGSARRRDDGRRDGDWNRDHEWEEPRDNDREPPRGGRPRKLSPDEARTRAEEQRKAAEKDNERGSAERGRATVRVRRKPESPEPPKE